MEWTGRNRQSVMRLQIASHRTTWRACVTNHTCFHNIWLQLLSEFKNWCIPLNIDTAVDSSFHHLRSLGHLIYSSCTYFELACSLWDRQRVSSLPCTQEERATDDDSHTKTSVLLWLCTFLSHRIAHIFTISKLRLDSNHDAHILKWAATSRTLPEIWGCWCFPLKVPQ